MPGVSYFKPRAVALSVLEEVVRSVEKLEALRLAHKEGHYQQAAAERMAVSRATFGRLLDAAHRGEGRNAVHLAGLGYRVEAVDLSSAALILGGGPDGSRIGLNPGTRPVQTGVVAALQATCRTQAEAPGRFEDHATEFVITVHPFTTVFVYPLGFPPSLDATAGVQPRPGPSTWITPRALSLITTHRCTAACEHCCFSCSPALDRAIPVPRLHSLIDEAAGIPTIQLIVFTGGECFLLGRHLDDLLRRCRGHGLHTRCVTNGYWAASPAAAAARAQELAVAGLQEINFSTGTFHARYVPVERILWGVKACAARGIRTLINVERFEASDFPEERLTGDGELQELQRDAGLIINRACWVPNGGEVWGCASQGRSSATGLEHPEQTLRFRGESNKTACPSSLAVLAVNPGQELITCCGLTLEHIPALHAGSLKDRTLGEAIAAIQPDLLKMWIHLEGPERILEWIKERDPDRELPLDSAHICHTCQYLHASPRAMAALRAHAREVEERIMEQYFLDSAALDWAGRTALAQMH